MKKILVFVFAVLSSTTLFAQSNKEDVDLIQSIFGKEKKTIVADFIKVDESKKAAFWTLYDQYEVERKELGKKRIALLEKYAANYNKMDDATTSNIINETAKLAVDTDKLILTYHKKFEKAAGVTAAAQFYQLESYFLSEIRVAIMENIPFIGELR